MFAQPNSEIATEFLAMAASGRVREAFQRHVADVFTHHNPYFPSDRESLLVAMEQSAATEPNKSFTVKQVIESGDRVAVLSHLQRAQADQQYAVVHILRSRTPGSSRCGISRSKSRRTRPMRWACSEA